MTVLPHRVLLNIATYAGLLVAQQLTRQWLMNAPSNNAQRTTLIRVAKVMQMTSLVMTSD